MVWAVQVKKEEAMDLLVILKKYCCCCLPPPPCARGRSRNGTFSIGIAIIIVKDAGHRLAQFVRQAAARILFLQLLELLHAPRQLVYDCRLTSDKEITIKIT